MIQLNLFRRSTAREALELASWMRVEIIDLRNQVKTLQASLKRQENNMNKLEGILLDLRQKELFEEGV